MISIENAQKAADLAEKRRQIVHAEWKELKGITRVRRNAVTFDQELSLPVDEPLRWAIEEFRKRKLDEIDAELRELGVEPPKMSEAGPVVDRPQAAARLRAIEAAHRVTDIEPVEIVRRSDHG